MAHPVCPCGCGQVTDPPINVQGIWHKDRPYWAWYCTRAGCERFQIEQQNQSGDPVCPWCGHDRQFVGHIERRLGWGARLTVLGERIEAAERPEHRFFKPYQTEGSPYQ